MFIFFLFTAKHELNVFVQKYLKLKFNIFHWKINQNIFHRFNIGILYDQ